MKQEINRFTAYTNCPPGEYLAIFTNSGIFKFNDGKRELLFFLILKDENSPLLNNKCEPYCSVIVCNKTKGVSPKSKISKIKLAMLNKDEYNPLDIHIGLPKIESFYERRFKVLVTAKGEDYNFITHIQRPRDLEWEHIEMEYEEQLESLKTKNNDLILFPNYLKHLPLPSLSATRISINMEIITNEDADTIFSVNS